MARSASPDSLRATATRSYSGDVPAASTSPKCRYTWASVRARPADTALPAVGPGTPTILAADGGHLAGGGPPGRSPGGRPGRRSGVLGGLGRWLPGAVGHEPARVLDHGVDHLARLPPGLGRGHLPAALADQRRQDGGVEPVEGGVRQPEQRVVLADPLATAPPFHHLEAGRTVPGVKQHRQVPALPAALEEGPRAGREQLERIGHAGLLGPRDRRARPRPRCWHRRNPAR